MSFEDQAQEIEAREWERNNSRKPAGKIRFSPGEPGYGPEYCADEDCGNEMPDERRAWGFSLCVECQTLVEQRRRSHS